MRSHFQLVTSASGDTERDRYFDLDSAEECFAETNLRNQPPLAGDDWCVTIEMWWHSREGATCLRRAWWCVTDRLRYQWDGSDQVDVYDGVAELDETPVAVDAFALYGERPETPTELLQACLAWERSHPAQVDHIEGRVILRLIADRFSPAGVTRAVQARAAEGHEASVRQPAADVAGVLEDLAGRLRSREIVSIHDYRAWVGGVLEALQQVSLHTGVLHAATAGPPPERV